MAAVTTVPAATLGRPIGQGGLLIDRGGMIVYFDPRDVPEGSPKADLICLSNVDPRDMSEKDVRAVASASTIIAGAAPCVARFRLNQLPLTRGQSKEALGLTLTLVDDDGRRVRWRLNWPDVEAFHPAP